MSATTISLFVTSLSPNFILSLVAFFIRLTSLTSRILLPIGTACAEPERQRELIRAILSGLLIDILGSRVLSDLIEKWF